MPFPPTDNRHKAVSGKRFIKSNEAKLFERDLTSWAWMNIGALKEARAFSKDRPRLRIHLLFQSPLWVTKQKLTRRMDVSNRLKSALDGISTLLHIDDCVFFYVSAEKRLGPKSEMHCAIDEYPS